MNTTTKTGRRKHLSMDGSDPILGVCITPQIPAGLGGRSRPQSRRNSRRCFSGVSRVRTQNHNRCQSCAVLLRTSHFVHWRTPCHC